MSSQLLDYLHGCKTLSSLLHTHVSLANPIGKYTIGTEMPIFWALYIKAIKNNTNLSIAEAPGNEMPVIVDVDLKQLFPVEYVFGDGFVPSYNKEDIKTLIGAYQSIIKNIIEDCPNDALVCVVLEKEPYLEVLSNGQQIVKNGFHLHFPKVFLDKQVHTVYLIPKIKHVLMDTIFFDAIDENSINVHWLLYGSSKPGKEPYKITHCLDFELKETNIEDEFAGYIVAKHPNEIIPKMSVIDLLPRILSTFLGNRGDLYFYNPKPSITTPLLDKFKNIRDSRKQYIVEYVESNVREAEEVIKFIDIKRANDRTDWLTIGFCIYNISEGDDDGLTCWLEFSESSEKYNEVECIALWNTMRLNKFTIGTLKHFAKTDNPERYAAWVAEKSVEIVTQIIKTSHNDIAKLLFNEYGSEFVCASIAEKTWYQFNNHVWQPVQKGTALRQRISCDNGIAIKLLRIRSNKAFEEGDDESIKAISKVIKSLKSAPGKNNIMIECAEVFYNKNFYNLLNTDANLFAFNNGIYDFEHNIFRDGKPEDYMSKQVSIDFVDYKSINHAKVIEIDDFFKKIFPNGEIRSYFLWQVSKVFIGGNQDKLCFFWTGSGNNGKTVTQNLFEKLLGSYAVKLGTGVVTGKKVQNGAANPEMSRLGDGVRWAVMEEPNADETIHSGILKNLTGNDSFFARDLYCSGKTTREIIPLFKLHFICNKLPNINNADIATWNRIRVIPFETTFVPPSECSDNVSDQEEEKRYPMDLCFSAKIPQLLAPLAWYLINIWQQDRWITENPTPNIVMAATDVYKNENDFFLQFANEFVIREVGQKLLFSHLNIIFKQWIKCEWPNAIINNKHIKPEFISILGQLKMDKYWDSYKIKELND